MNDLEHSGLGHQNGRLDMVDEPTGGCSGRLACRNWWMKKNEPSASDGASGASKRTPKLGVIGKILKKQLIDS